MGGHLTFGEVNGKTPHFLFSAECIEGVKDKISIVILAVGHARNIILRVVEYTTKYGKEGGRLKASLTEGRVQRTTPEKRWATTMPPNIRVVMHLFIDFDTMNVTTR